MILHEGIRIFSRVVNDFLIFPVLRIALHIAPYLHFRYFLHVCFLPHTFDDHTV